MERDSSAYPDISPISFTHSVFPSSESCAKSISMPFGFFATPMISKRDRSHIRDDKSLENQYKFDKTFAIQRCQQCFGYINRYCELSSNRYFWYCSICGFRNALPKQAQSRFRKQGDVGFTMRQKFNNLVDFDGIPELTENLYDVPWSDSSDGTSSQATSGDEMPSDSRSIGNEQAHILLIHESGPEDSLTAITSAISQAVMHINDNILVCIVTFSHTRIGVMSFIDDVAAIQYSYLGSTAGSNRHIISDFFDFFAAAKRAGDIRSALLKGLGSILEVRDKEGFETRDFRNEMTKEAFQTAYELVLDWIHGGFTDKIVNLDSDTSPLPTTAVENSKQSGVSSLIGGLFGGIRSTLEFVKDGLLGKDEAFESSNGSGASNVKSVGSRNRRFTVPIDRCSTIVIHTFISTYLDANSNSYSNSSSNSNSNNRAKSNNLIHSDSVSGNKESVSDWVDRMCHLISNECVVNNIWTVNSFKSYQFSVAAFMPLVNASGGKYFRVVLGHVTQSGLSQLTEQVSRELSEQRFIVKALKYRASPGLEMNRHSVVGNVNEHKELFDVYCSNSMTAESSLGFQLQWNPNKYVDVTSSGYGGPDIVPKPGIDGGVVVQLAIAYETLVESTESSASPSPSTYSNEISAGSGRSEKGDSSSLFEDTSEIFGLKSSFRRKLIDFIDSSRKKNSHRNSRKTMTRSSAYLKLEALISKISSELTTSNDPLVAESNSKADGFLSELSDELLRTRRSSNYNKSSQLVLVKRLRIITYRIDVSSRIPTVVQSINPPILTHLFTTLSLKNTHSITQAAEVLRDFCLSFISGMSFLVVRKEEVTTIREIFEEIVAMTPFSDTFRFLYGAFDLLRSMAPALDKVSGAGRSYIKDKGQKGPAVADLLESGQGADSEGINALSYDRTNKTQYSEVVSKYQIDTRSDSDAHQELHQYFDVSDENSEILRNLTLYDPSNMQVLYLPHLIPISSLTLKIVGRPIRLMREAMLIHSSDLFLLDSGTDVILYRAVGTSTLGSVSNTSIPSANSNIIPVATVKTDVGDRSDPIDDCNKAKVSRNVKIYLNTKLINSPELKEDLPANNQETSRSGDSNSSVASNIPKTTSFNKSSAANIAISDDNFLAFNDDPDWLLNDIINRISYSPVVARYSLAEAGTSTSVLFSSLLIEDCSRSSGESFNAFKDSIIETALSKYFPNEV